MSRNQKAIFFNNAVNNNVEGLIVYNQSMYILWKGMKAANIADELIASSITKHVHDLNQYLNLFVRKIENYKLYENNLVQRDKITILENYLKNLMRFFNGVSSSSLQKRNMKYLMRNILVELKCLNEFSSKSENKTELVWLPNVVKPE
ncbi:hypothetical protein WAK64_09285 [Bacillus spongiae]|uniref:Uncharacterized protein n=1 Tax=Bacillus spongiae TaxID=2683610 RepID=A0ABU8HDN1_9BACI